MKWKSLSMGRSTRHLLTLLSLVVVAAAIGFAYQLVREEENQFSRKFDEQHGEIEDFYQSALQDRTDKLGAVLDAILLDSRFAEPLRNRDRATLLKLSSPLFKRLRDRYRVTHLYFHDPGRVNLLRAHQPDRFGDRIDRFTALAAQSTGRPSSGVELGPLGTLTLRIVAPFHDGGTLLGYVELGEEIEDLAARTDRAFGGEGYLLLDKRHLQPDGFAAGMKMLGRKGVWGRFADFVVASRSDAGISGDAAGLLSQLPREETAAHRVVQRGKRFLGLHIKALTDAGGRTVGRHLMLMDLTSQYARVRALLLREGGLLLVITIGAILAFHWLLRRREQELDASYARLDRAHKEQSVIAELQRIGLRDNELTQKLQSAIELLVDIHWLAIEAKGAIFLTDGKDRLHLAAHQGLPLELQSLCRQVPFGHCLCGRAAAERSTLFSSHLDAQHDVDYPGILDHGHYCLPLVAGEQLLGVLNLYVEAGHRREGPEEAFLDSVAHALATLIERGHAEEQLRQSRDSLAEAQRVAQLGNWDWDIAANTLAWSDEIYRIFGLEPQGFGATYEAFLDTVHPEDREFVERGVRQALEQRLPYSIDHRIVLPDGGIRVVHEQAEVHFGEGGEPLRMIGTVQDVTGRKGLEDRLRHTNRALRLLSDCNMALIRAESEAGLLQRICDILTGPDGYKLAWVGVKEDGEPRRVLPVARAGERSDYLDEVSIHWGDDEFGQGPTGRAIRSGQPQIMRHIDSDSTFAPWREQALGRGYRSSAAMPLQIGGQTFGALHFYAAESDAFTDDELKLLGEMTEDLAFGIAHLRGEQLRAQAEEGLRLSSRAMEAAYNGIILTEAGDGQTITYVNPAFERITGYSLAEAVGRTPDFLFGDDREQPGLQAIRDAVRDRREGNALLRNYRKDRTLFWNDLRVAPVVDKDGEVSHFVGILNDVSNEHRYLEELEHQVTHDRLTGLYNRNLLHDRLTQAIAMAERGGHYVGVLYLDLDRFKLINDSLGHAAGDELLRVVARRLQEGIREGDTLARYGGDEFVIILPQIDSPRMAAIFAERILASSSEILEIAGEEAPLSLSLGAAIYPRDGRDADTLIRNAGAAMSKARKEGSGYRFFTDDLGADARERLQLELDLRRGLKAGELLLHYQPQATTPGGQIFGVEALVRWRHPQNGLVPPDRFIPLAEETGLILPLGEWVLREACRQAVAWREAGLPPLTLSVNLSVHQIEHSDLATTIRAVLAETGLEPGRLELEITESLFMERLEVMEAKIGGLKALGCRLSLDDFGTGYSSLSALKRLAFDKLKIDRGFITDIPEDPGNAVIAQTIIAMANSLGLEVIAEGVETLAQLHWLTEHGCNQIQGYYLSRPLPATELEALLRAGQRPLSA